MDMTLAVLVGAGAWGLVVLAFLAVDALRERRRERKARAGDMAAMRETGE